MKIGIIDIGSNTIKAYVFPENSSEATDGRSLAARLLNYTEGGTLSPEGFLVVNSAVTQLAAFLRERGCGSIYALATSAVRDCDNACALCEYISESCGVTIQVLSGEQEALCDLARARAFSGKARTMALDMGGGSAQLMVFDSERLLQSHSFQLGALRMKNEFFEAIFPTADEEANLRSHVRRSISERGFTPEGLPALVMGGTSQTAQSLFTALGLYSADELYPRDIFAKALSELSKLDFAARLSLLQAHTPKRTEIIYSGYIVLDEILTSLEAGSVKIISGGVREGFLELKRAGVL